MIVPDLLKCYPFQANPLLATANNMAAPEIQLPWHSNTSGESSENQDVEKSEGLDVRRPETLAATPVVYRFLEFETELPSPTSLRASDPKASPPPEPPDLSNYVSPFTWSSSRKTYTISLSCAITVFTAYSAGSYAAASDQLIDYWGVSPVAIKVGITTFTTGFATAPMVLAPFSELNGRKPVFIATGILFVIGQLCCAVTRSYAGMLAARFLTGVGGSTFSTMVGGVVSDIYATENRNTPMALFSGSALLGTGLGPLCSGFIAQHLSWRWVFYVQVIVDGFFILLVAVFFKETRGSVLLSRKAHKLNDWYAAREEAGLTGFDVVVEGSDEKQSQRIRWKVKADEEKESLVKMIGISVYRPFHLLTTEPVVFWFSLWVAFSWAVLYLTFSSIPLVFSTNHHFNIQQNGAVFAAMCVGALLASILCIYQEKMARHYGMMSSSPEGRLYFCCFESALLPIGLFWFGWTQFSQVHWIVPTMAIGCATMGIFSIYLCVFNYLADTYHRYASSALAAQSFCRNMLGGIFPLVGDAMFNSMTYQGASSFLGGVGTLLTIVPWVLVLYGPKIRARSKFASEIMN